MFDNNVFIEGTCHNVEEDGKIIGYEMDTYITYYRGIPLSMINFLAVEVDGVKVPAENIRFTPDHIDWFSLDPSDTYMLHKMQSQTDFLLQKYSIS